MENHGLTEKVTNLNNRSKTRIESFSFGYYYYYYKLLCAVGRKIPSMNWYSYFNFTEPCWFIVAPGPVPSLF